MNKTKVLIEQMPFLLDAGAEIDATTDKDHRTPLMLAAARADLNHVKLLVERGARLDLQGVGQPYPGNKHVIYPDEACSTALDFAVDASMWDFYGRKDLSVIQYLRETMEKQGIAIQ